MFRQSGKCLLLLVIGRISEYARVKTARIAVTTLDHHSMFVCSQEFIVEDDRPLSMVHLPIAMAHKHGIRFLANVLCCKGGKCTGQLSFGRN